MDGSNAAGRVQSHDAYGAACECLCPRLGHAVAKHRLAAAIEPGAGKIERLVQSYAREPFAEIAGGKVIRATNFGTETIRDIEGDEIPKENMLIFALEDHTRIAIRASGTEPKIKYYLLAEHRPQDRQFQWAELDRIKTERHDWLTRLWDWLQADARERVAR